MLTASATPAVIVIAAEGEKPPLIPHIPELIFGLAMVAIVYLVVAMFVVPKLEKAYAERRAAIEGGIEQADEAKAAAEAAKSQYEAQLAEARTEAAQIREDARAEGAQIVAEMREQAQAEAARITESASKQIAAERQQAEVALRSDVGRLSTDLATKIIGQELTDQAAHKSLIDRFLTELESGQVQPEKVGADRTDV
ncbi:F0F1 ATP synthase subunit B [Janibacter sp. GXQ6167]|uniref:F0F1 ATP synthase subunit B n=1 Tax=Janibacter sp. GXQ6167 TaxID=3240791 RepID=UPI0035265F02